MFTNSHKGKIKERKFGNKMPKNLLQFQNFIFGFMPAKMFEETGFSKKDFITLSKTMKDLDFSNTLDNVGCPVLLFCS